MCFGFFCVMSNQMIKKKKKSDILSHAICDKRNECIDNVTVWQLAALKQIVKQMKTETNNDLWKLLGTKFFIHLIYITNKSSRHFGNEDVCMLSVHDMSVRWMNAAFAIIFFSWAINKINIKNNKYEEKWSILIHILKSVLKCIDCVRTGHIIFTYFYFPHTASSNYSSRWTNYF